MNDFGRALHHAAGWFGLTHRGRERSRERATRLHWIVGSTVIACTGIALIVAGHGFVKSVGVVTAVPFGVSALNGLLDRGRQARS